MSKHSIKGISSEKIPSLKLLRKLGVIDEFHNGIVNIFLEQISEAVEIEKDDLLAESTKRTLEEKIGNSVGASCYGSIFNNVSDRNNFINRSELLFSLLSLQFLADLGDTYIDSKMNRSSSHELIEKVDQIYSLHPENEDSSVLNYLRKSILKLMKEEDSISIFFSQRWYEFVQYQKTSLMSSYNLFSEVTERLLSEFKLRRIEMGLPTMIETSQFSRIEKFYSKGGTISLLSLLREASLETESRSDFNTVDLVSGSMDVLNFASDHFADILEDHIGNDDRSLNTFLRKLFLGSVQKNLNAVHAEVVERFRLDNKTSEDLYLTKALGYYLDLIDRVDSIVKQNWSLSPNSYLIAPMVMHFFIDGKSPTPKLNQIVNNKAVSLSIKDQ